MFTDARSRWLGETSTAGITLYVLPMPVRVRVRVPVRVPVRVAQKTPQRVAPESVEMPL